MRRYGNFQITERHLNDRIVVAESHAMGCGEKEGDERYTAEGVGEDCPKN